MPTDTMPGPTTEERWALLNRVAASPQLRRSNRLRDFLIFVGTQSIQLGITDISEHTIGVSVFERPVTYDTSLDNIVRVNATELRKRIKSYFDEDGAQEMLLLEIPRGGYTPVFQRREIPVEPVATVMPSTHEAAIAEPIVPPAASPARRMALIYGLLAGVVLLAVMCAMLFWQNRRLEAQMHPWQNQPSLRLFWSNFLGQERHTDVVLADTSFALAQDILHRTLTLNEYLTYSYTRLGQFSGISDDRRADLEQVLQRNNGSIGDFRVARRIVGLDHDLSAAQVKFARDYTTESLKLDSTILIGSRKSNPWVDLFNDQLEFQVVAAQDRSQSFVEVRHPSAGEQPRYNASSDPAAMVGYCVIAFLPNLSRRGSALIIAGTDSQATEAAGEFMTTEEPLGAFLAKLPRPLPYFQLLLKTARVNGTPISSEIIAYRTSAR